MSQQSVGDWVDKNGATWTRLTGTNTNLWYFRGPSEYSYKVLFSVAEIANFVQEEEQAKPKAQTDLEQEQKQAKAKAKAQTDLESEQERKKAKNDLELEFTKAQIALRLETEKMKASVDLEMYKKRAEMELQTKQAVKFVDSTGLTWLQCTSSTGAPYWWQGQEKVSLWNEVEIEEHAAAKKAEQHAAAKKAEENAAAKKAEEHAATAKKAEDEAAAKKAEDEAERAKKDKNWGSSSWGSSSWGSSSWGSSSWGSSSWMPDTEATRQLNERQEASRAAARPCSCGVKGALASKYCWRTLCKDCCNSAGSCKFHARRC